MSEEEKQNQDQVGTWDEYLAYQSKKAVLGSVGPSAVIIGGIGALAMGLLFIAVIGFLVCDMAGHLTDSSYWTGIFALAQQAAIPLLIALLIMGGCAGIAWTGYKAHATSCALPPVLPPTRENLDALPIQNVLVRASAEPSEEAGKTLLRAIVSDAETPAEELLRPTSQG